MRNVLSPRTARHARLLRLVQAQHPTMPAGEQMVLVNSHVSKEADKQLSEEEERIRVQQLPNQISSHAFVAHGQAAHGNLFQFREFPMYPGEYIPSGHRTLSSLRDELRQDLTAQNIKAAWLRASGSFFTTIEEYYASVDGIDAGQLGEIVAACVPGLNRYESRALVTRVLELISKPADSTTRQIGRIVTADAVGLDNAPGHYSNFLDWMGRLTETKAFKTEHALFQFTRRKFSRKDVRMMFENYSLLSQSALQRARSDSYGHFYAVLKDFAVKVSHTDTRHQIGVRIDPREADESSGISVGYGEADNKRYAFVAAIRENREGTGSITVNGSPLHVFFDNKSWLMEFVLQPFDEANLDARDFDVSLMSEGKAAPFSGNDIAATAARFAVATSITKLMPLTRIALKKAGLLSFDRRAELGQHPGFLDSKRASRRFAKR